MRRAFYASVTDLQSQVDWPALLRALELGDIEGAVFALHIDAAAFSEYSSTMTAAYAASGASTAAQIGRVGVRFNMSNPRAEAWVRDNVVTSVTRMTNEQISNARAVIAEGYSLGKGPRNIALDLVGRVQNGVRQGGILGLDTPRAERYRKVVEAMKTPEGVKSIVTKHANGTLSVDYKVNKATEARILRAYRDETEVPLADRLISENQYKNALLKARAETIAETETGNAVMSARQEEWRQAAESIGLNESAVQKTWRHRRGASKFHRPDHLAMSGKSVMGLFTKFVFPDGTQMEHSQDSAGGASHVIRCGCTTEYYLVERVS